MKSDDTIKSEPKIHAGHIEVAVAALFDYRKFLIVPNISWGWGLNYEADMIAVNDNNRVTEIEIKISIADLKNDFKKHHKHDSIKVGRLYYAIPERLFDKALDIIPKDAGIITVRWHENIGRYIAKYQRVVKYRKYNQPITESQRMKLAELGCMRIWSLKHHNNYNR